MSEADQFYRHNKIFLSTRRDTRLRSVANLLPLFTELYDYLPQHLQV